MGKPFVFDNLAFAAAFKQYRELQDKSQRRIAQELGIESSIISQIEKGHYKGPQLVILLSFYAGLNPTDYVVKNGVDYELQFELPLGK